MNNWISSITNPSKKFTRKATSFSGSVVNFYPWPVASVVQKLAIKGAMVMNTGPLLGTTVGAILQSGSPTLQSDSRYGSSVIFDPVRVAISSGYDGQYSNADGEYVLNPSGFGYLRVKFGQPTVGPVDIYVEGYESDSDFINVQDSNRATRAKYNKISIGDSSGSTQFIKFASPPTFRTVSLVENSAFNISGGTYTYLSSTAPFGGIQVNLSSEGYATRTKAYSLQYWNGAAWTGLTPTASTVSAWSDGDLVFHQSGIITWNKPSDWVVVNWAGGKLERDVIGGGPASGSNLSYDPALYYVRIVPPTPNAESVAVSSITFFD